MKEVLVFGFSEGRCPYCDRVKALLTNKEIEFQYFDVKEADNMNKLLSLRGKEDLRGETVPQVFFDGEYIGGFAETRDILR